MVKIISRKSLGTQKVYDIGVENDHNFILTNGLVASNCFNKSHSTAYAYVTYQTAYLKANYRDEYMAALLSANSGDQDKVQKYIASCISMKIKVESPDVNRSGVDFTPAPGKILFGLSAVRNVGQGAVECILAARHQGGTFKSLADLCDRVDLRAVNRRALEAMIQCGAFDQIESNRNQLLQDLDLVIDWAQNKAKDRASGQCNIFDLLGGTSAESKAANSSFESAPKATPVEDFPAKKKLELEKELLGFYVSDHPLKFAQKAATRLNPVPITLSQIEDQRVKATISLIVMLTDIKQITTKKGDLMAILQIEDITGQAEAVVFPKTYESVSSLLVTDVPMLLSGKVDKREDKTQLIVENAEPIELEQLIEEAEQLEMEYLVVIQLTPQRVNDQRELQNLETMLKEYSGDQDKVKVPVMAIVSAPHGRAEVRLGQEFWVQDYQQAVDALNTAGFPAYSQSPKDA